MYVCIHTHIHTYQYTYSDEGFVDRSSRGDTRRGLCDLVAAQRTPLVYRDLEAVQSVVVPSLDLVNRYARM